MIHKFSPKKKAPKISFDLIKKKSSGFALMVALGLMTFVLLIILGLTTLTQVNNKLTSSGKYLAEARQNALFALNLAIGDLQNEMGPDQRISATASILDEIPETEFIDGVNNPYWTGTWDSNNALKGERANQVISQNRASSDGKPSHFRRWLISTPLNDSELSSEEKIAFAKNFSKNLKGATLMVGSGTLGEEAKIEKSVYVPRQILDKELGKESGYAYWVGDEGVKTRVAGAQPKNIETNLEKILNVNNAATPRLNAIEGFANVEDISDQADKILTIGTAQFAFNDALGGNIDAFKSKFHSLSAFSRGLLVDVKHGGIRRDLSLLFATEELPMEFHEKPIFEYDASEGPYWNYVHRYHNIYKKIRNDGGRNYLNTSDFWSDAEIHDISDSDARYTDLPIPVLARMQVIFSLHRQRNTWHGSYNDQIYDPVLNPITSGTGGGGDGPTSGGPTGGPTTGGPTGGPTGGGPTGGPTGGGPTGGDPEEPEPTQRTNIFTAWEPFSGAEINLEGFWCVPSGSEEEAGFRIQDFQAIELDAYPFYFFEDGNITLTANLIEEQPIDVYFKFAQSGDTNTNDDYITDPITIQSSNSQTYSITIPEDPSIYFNSLTMHFVSGNHGCIQVDSVSITDSARVSTNLIFDDVAKPQDNNQDVLHLMMTPIFYLWNPYNIEIVMDRNIDNWGSYEYFFGPPDIEFTYTKNPKQNDWIALRNSGSFQFGSGKELMAIWSSNNFYNKATKGRPIEIPAGEFRYNRVIPTMRPNSTNPDYTKMQFFDIYSLTYQGLFDEPFSPVVANWLETTDSLKDTGYKALTGLFTPILNTNTIDYNGRRTTYPKDNTVKKLLTYTHPSQIPGGQPIWLDYGPEGEQQPMGQADPYYFNIRLKNQFFISRLSLGAGWNERGSNYDVNFVGGHLQEKRMIGALNIDNGDSVQNRSYHDSTLDSPIEVYHNQLYDIVDDSGNWVGMEDSPKIALNVDIRGFTEEDTPGKHSLFIDPANTYYYDDESDDTALAVSPFRIYVKEITASDELIPLHPIEEEKVGFETSTGDIIYKSVSKELPLIPLLSLTQLDHAPLGRDYDHFAYYSGRRKINEDRWHYETESLADDSIIFREKKDDVRPMAPSFNMAVGNSWAHPTIPLNNIIATDDTYEGNATDRSYLLNETLFDSYFFSGIGIPSGPFIDDMTEMGDLLRGWVNKETKLPNSNYLFKLPSSLSFDETVNILSYNTVDPLNLFDKIANFIEIEGAFNINSTSVESWVAQLSALRGKPVLYDNSERGNYNIDTTNLENTPVLSQAIPAEKSLENTGGSIDEIIENSWSHYRSLEDSQILKLATEIVKQIKSRGPFLSLSQFFNREVSERYPYNLKGAIQTAIDDSYINLESPDKNVASALTNRFDSNPASRKWVSNTNFDSPEVFEDDANQGLPGYITQATLMRPLSPTLSARSDTFIIRAYGDVIENGENRAKAWCEAIVQRRIDLIDQGNDLFNTKFSKEDSNAFNRRFEVVSFRWLNADEI